MRGKIVLLFILMLRSDAQASNCNVFRSSPGTYLKSRLFYTSPVPGLPQCTGACLGHYHCKSTNFDLKNKTCELNNADKFDFPSDLIPREGFVYSGWKYKQKLKSCAEIKLRNPNNTVSGYYTVTVRGYKRLVYCDMKIYGGGWTLVVSISAHSNDHLQTTENNCRDSFLCVTYSKSNIPARKLCDKDIIALASYESTFMVVKLGSTPLTCFYQLPAGSNHFSSTCLASSCARIIISHQFPYRWESNCKGINVGYKIMHHVFDGHDSMECSGYWRSSLYRNNPRGSGRCLYGYKQNDNTGIYFQEEGLLFVR